MQALFVLTKSMKNKYFEPVYMKKFIEQNPEIENTMKTHLIGNFEKFGIIRYLETVLNLLFDSIEHNLYHGQIYHCL
jgi:hypothetical protein